MLNIALPKGRLGDKVYDMLAAAGYDCPGYYEQNRKLGVTDRSGGGHGRSAGMVRLGCPRRRPGSLHGHRAAERRHGAWVKRFFPYIWAIRIAAATQSWICRHAVGTDRRTG